MVALQPPIELDSAAPRPVVRSSRNHRNLRAYVALAPFLVLYGVLIVIPTIGMLVKSVSTNQSAEFEILNPSLLVHTTYTLKNYATLFSQFGGEILTTIVISLIAVLLTVIIGTPISYQLAIDKNRVTGATNWVLSLPIYMPIVVIAYAIVLLLGPNGILNAASSVFGIPIWDITYTTSAVVLGTVYVLVPLYVRMLTAAFGSVPLDLMGASMSLGAGELRTLLKVVLPIVRPTLLAGVIIDFAFAIGMVEIALIVGGGTLKVAYLPVDILQRSQQFAPDIPLTSAMAALLVVIALIGQFVAERLNRKA